MKEECMTHHYACICREKKVQSMMKKSYGLLSDFCAFIYEKKSDKSKMNDINDILTEIEDYLMTYEKNNPTVKAETVEYEK